MIVGIGDKVGHWEEGFNNGIIKYITNELVIIDIEGKETFIPKDNISDLYCPTEDVKFFFKKECLIANEEFVGRIILITEDHIIVRSEKYGELVFGKDEDTLWIPAEIVNWGVSLESKN